MSENLTPSPQGESPAGANVRWAKTRLPFQDVRSPVSGAVKSGAVWLYLALMIGCVGLALYMALVVRHPWTSPYVAAPIVGGGWFGLRLFMSLGRK